MSEIEKAKKGRNLAIMFTLIGLVAIMYLVTLVRMGGVK